MEELTNSDNKKSKLNSEEYLDQFPIEILEIVLDILEAQEKKHAPKTGT